MTWHRAQHKGPTRHKGNRRPCPRCGRNMRKVYDKEKAKYSLLHMKLPKGWGKTGIFYKCGFCGTSGAKEEFHVVRSG